MIEAKEEPVEIQPEEATLKDEDIGPKNGKIRCTFKVCIRQYTGQQQEKGIELPEWTIRADTVEQFREFVWTLAQPHLKRAIDVATVDGLPVTAWGEQPSFENADRFIQFLQKQMKKRYCFSHNFNPLKINQWNGQNVNITLCQYSSAVTTRQIHEIAMKTLLGFQPGQVPGTLKKPTVSTRRIRSKPTNKDAGDDDYSFTEEVQALRETFHQMRDLVTILDHRIALLEAKCSSNVQPQEPELPVEIKNATVETEPTGHPDPLLMVAVKEESMDLIEYDEVVYLEPMGQ